MTFNAERTSCPKCGGSRSLAIDAESGWGWCHKNSCRIPPGAEFDFKPEDAAVEGLIAAENIKYGDLSSRGASLDVCRRYRYGATTYNGKPCQVATYLDDSGRPRRQKLRFADKKFQWLHAPGAEKEPKTLFGQQVFDQGRERTNGLRSRIIVTEGELDALCAATALGSWPVVSLPDGSSSIKSVKEQLEWLETFEEIVLALDGDEAGSKATAELLSVFTPGKVKVVRWPSNSKDACDVFAAKGHQALKHLLWDAKTYAPEWVCAGDDVLVEIFDNTLEPGFPWPWAGLEQAFEGIRPKQLTLIAAGTSSGKSLFCRHLALHCAEQGKKVGYIALEESPRQSALGVYGVALKKHLQLESDLPEEDIRRVHEELGDRLVFSKHWGSAEDDALIKKLRYCIKGMDCDVIFLDHISIAVSSLDHTMDERRALDRLMTGLRVLTEESAVHMFVVSHLRRAKDGAHEEGKSVSTAHLRGSHSLGQLSDNVIALERDQQNADTSVRNTTTVRVLKNRDVGRLGVVTALKFNPQNHCLSEAPLQTSDYTTEDFA